MKQYRASEYTLKSITSKTPIELRTRIAEIISKEKMNEEDSLGT